MSSVGFGWVQPIKLYCVMQILKRSRGKKRFRFRFSGKLWLYGLGRIESMCLFDLVGLSRPSVLTVERMSPLLFPKHRPRVPRPSCLPLPCLVYIPGGWLVSDALVDFPAIACSPSIFQFVKIPSIISSIVLPLQSAALFRPAHEKLTNLGSFGSPSALMPIALNRLSM